MTRLSNGRPLMIFGSTRSGTELIGELLGSHPRLLNAGEIFTAPRRYPVAYVSGKASLARRSGNDVWAFKLIFQQLRWGEASFGTAPRFLKQLHDRGFTFLVVDRRNRLLQALSYIHAERTKYHFRCGERARFEPYEVDPIEVVTAMHTIDENANWAHRILGDLPRLELCYEDDLSNPETQIDSVRRVLTAVGLDLHTPRTSLVSVAPRSVSERVLNYEDLVATLGHTRFAGFLDD